MATLDNIKNRLIDRILLTKNKKLLFDLENMISSSETEQELTFDSYQIEMLLMSEEDIKEGKLISEADLEEKDAKWMN
ncbi:hypothetical protein C8N46_10597 [Kordia periserrulae]|uniref:Uncharacterized protein n=1 Tax=Kordia periserrulae TaxID=701523 RepID=A0A2T6BXY1_9FLAO|nr:hypothetical protein [Kordia periserrulae]PTX60941.1 hypothetical protein C8N46_10597 [Kordia periserrulae]